MDTITVGIYGGRGLRYGAQRLFALSFNIKFVSRLGRERAERVSVRQHQAAMRLTEQTRKAEQRIHAEMARATSAEKKRLEIQARESHIAAKEAEVDERNKKLDDNYAEIDSILAATLPLD